MCSVLSATVSLDVKAATRISFRDWNTGGTGTSLSYNPTSVDALMQDRFFTLTDFELSDYVNPNISSPGGGASITTRWHHNMDCFYYYDTALFLGWSECTQRILSGHKYVVYSPTDPRDSPFTVTVSNSSSFSSVYGYSICVGGYFDTYRDLMSSTIALPMKNDGVAFYGSNVLYEPVNTSGSYVCFYLILHCFATYSYRYWSGDGSTSVSFYAPKVSVTVDSSKFSKFYMEEFNGQSYEITTKDPSYTLNPDTGEYEYTENTTTESLDQGGIFSKIINSIVSIPNLIIDGIKSLFIPSAADMQELLGKLNIFFEDTFGFLYAPFDYFAQLVAVLMADSSSTGLTLPGFSIMGYEVWKEQTYDITSNSVFMTVSQFIKTGTGVIIVMAFLNFLKEFFDKRFGGVG